jgi:tRNA(Ile)-lysidine synthase
MPTDRKRIKFHSLEIKVRRTLRKYGMLSGGEHVLVAVSGGADSTALLLCLHRIAAELRLRLTAAHLNHRIRGAEGDEDESFVRQMSVGLGIPYISETLEIKQEAIATKRNLEELARIKRYDFLARTAKQVGAQKIAAGHNLNDQAETVLFRFLRGSGIEGLAAIHPIVEGTLIRPLIECSRVLILDYLKCRGAQFREDFTNNDLRHTRNRIRRELIPCLEKYYNPQIIKTLAREALLSREAWSYIEAQGIESFEKIKCSPNNSIELKITDLLTLHPAMQKQVLRQGLKECLGSLRGISSIHIDDLLALCKSERSGTRLNLPHGSIAERQFNSLVLRKKAPDPKRSFIYQLGIPGECSVPEAGMFFSCSIGNAPDPAAMKSECSMKAYLESSLLTGSLAIRSRTPGDCYGGLGRRKVKKMLIDSKIPLSRRSELPLVIANEDVIWIPGFRPARLYEAKPGSSGCIVIEVIKTETGSKEAFYCNLCK